MDAQESENLLVVGLPECMTCQEQYHYQIEVSSNPFTYVPIEPDGEIKIEVPVDGANHLSAKEIERLKQKIEGNPKAAANNRVGWLAIAPPPDWEHDWRRPVGLEILPVPLAAGGVFVNDDTQIWTRGYRFVTRHAYLPEMPLYLPVGMDVQVYDDMSAPEDDFDKYLKHIRATGLEQGYLVIDIHILLQAPAILIGPQTHAILKTFRLDWETIAPREQLEILPLPSNSALPTTGFPEWIYNPDLRAIEIHELDAEPVRYADDSAPVAPLTAFQFDLRLVLKSPGQIFSRDELTGSFEIEIDGLLLSGRKARWVMFNGMPAPKDFIRNKTVIDAGFNALLSDRFCNRRTVTYREWYFNGVSLNAARLSSIKDTLADMGYSAQLIGDNIIRAQRHTHLPDGSIACLDLILLLEAVEQSVTRSERMIPGETRIVTERTTGDLRIRARGAMFGSGSPMAIDMDKLMVTLKRRLASTAELR